uniref:Uncharacterized protein n=1 Tax=Timema monikensis TaxID=170555 RepID=A0A7R9EE54_9NEOP|nr:unnamed protein product [Timema monikensis]
MTQLWLKTHGRRVERHKTHLLTLRSDISLLNMDNGVKSLDTQFTIETAFPASLPLSASLPLGVIGAALFMYKDGKTSGDGGESLVGFGEFLLILSLTMDGLTGAIQERMRSEHQTKSGHMMLNMNLWSILYMGVALFLTVQYIFLKLNVSTSIAIPQFMKKIQKIFIWNCALHSASDVVFDCCAHAHIGGSGEEGGTAR